MVDIIRTDKNVASGDRENGKGGVSGSGGLDKSMHAVREKEDKKTKAKAKTEEGEKSGDSQ